MALYQAELRPDRWLPECAGDSDNESLRNILRKENRIHPLGLHDGDNLAPRRMTYKQPVMDGERTGVPSIALP